MSKVLITGGMGSIGKNLIQLLAEKGEVSSILIIDNLTSSNPDLYLDTKLNIDLQICDISNREKIPPLVQSFNPDYIFHLAAHFANQNSVDFPFSDIETNVIGILNLLISAKECSNLKKFIYASSSCIYGTESELMNIDQKIYPHETPYAINKYVGELYCAYFNQLFKLPTISIRIFNTYGPGELSGKYRNVIPNFIFKALHNQPITITGNGEETRDFTYVSDTCNLLLLASKYSSDKHVVFNGGTGKKLKIIDLAKRIVELSNSQSEIIFVPSRNWDQVKDRCADIALTQERLGYLPIVGIDDGLTKTIDWYKAKLKI
jgi:nucleoside-diphosphate-sugar epimerase